MAEEEDSFILRNNPSITYTFCVVPNKAEHEILQRGISAFPGLNDTQARFEIQMFTCSARLCGLDDADAERGAREFVDAGSGADEALPVLRLPGPRPPA